MTLKELREKRARIITNARSKFDEITDDTKAERAAEIEGEFDAMMADADALDQKIGRMERLEQAEAADAEARERSREERRPGSQSEVRAGADGGDAPTYEDVFYKHLRALGEVGEPLTAEERAILRRGSVNVEARAQTTTDAEGGYTVPQQLAAGIVKSMAAWGPMYDPGITSEMVTSGGGLIDLPTVDDTGSGVNTHTEGATLDDDGTDDAVFGNKQLGAFEFDTGFLRLSLALINDSAVAMQPVLEDLLGERLGRRANLELTTGSGSSAPNGIVTAATVGVTAASATAVTTDELLDLEHSVDPAYRQSRRTAYMFNDLTLRNVRKLKNSEGDYIWQQGNIVNGVPDTINGRPFYINQAMPAMTTGLRSMVFGDFSKYWVRKVGQPLIGAIQDKDFWPGIGIAGYIRFDGELMDTAAVKALVMA